MTDHGRKSFRGKSRRAQARHRLLGHLLAISFVLSSSPLLPSWPTVTSADSGTQLVQLCTDKGLRLVAVPSEDALPAPHSDDDKRTGFDCASCPLGKCSGSAPAVVSVTVSMTTGAATRVAIVDHQPTTIRITLGPPTRAPPTVA